MAKGVVIYNEVNPEVLARQIEREKEEVIKVGRAMDTTQRKEMLKTIPTSLILAEISRRDGALEGIYYSIAQEMDKVKDDGSTTHQELEVILMNIKHIVNRMGTKVAH